MDLNSTQYNSGESGNNTLKLGSAQHMEKVQANSDTISLSSPQRFYVSRDNSIPYVITQNDTTASNYGKGICNITVTQDVRREDKDRPDLGICDYIDPSSPLPPTPQPPNETTDLSAVISGNATLKNGYKRHYTAKFADRNGNSVDWQNVNYQWNVKSDFDVKQTINDNKIIVSVNDENLIGGSFFIQVLIDKTILSEIEISIVE